MTLNFGDLTTRRARSEHFSQVGFNQNGQNKPLEPSYDNVLNAQDKQSGTQAELDSLTNEVLSAQSALASAQSALGNIPQTITDEDGNVVENPDYAAAQAAVTEAQAKLDEANAKQASATALNDEALAALNEAQTEYDTAMTDYEADVEAWQEAQEEEPTAAFEDEAQEEQDSTAIQEGADCQDGAKDPIIFTSKKSVASMNATDSDGNEITINPQSDEEFTLYKDTDNQAGLTGKDELAGYNGNDELQKDAGEDNQMSWKELQDKGYQLAYKTPDGKIVSVSIDEYCKAMGIDDRDSIAFSADKLQNTSQAGEVNSSIDAVDDGVDVKQTFEDDETLNKKYGFNETETETTVEYLDDERYVDKDGNLTDDGVKLAKEATVKAYLPQNENESDEDYNKRVEAEMEKINDEEFKKFFSIDKDGNLVVKNVDYWAHGEAKGVADCPWNFATKIFGQDNLVGGDKIFEAIFGNNIQTLTGKWNSNLNGSTSIKVETAPKQTKLEEEIAEALPQAGGEWEVVDGDDGATSFKLGENVAIVVENYDKETGKALIDGQTVTITEQNGGYVIEYPEDNNGAVKRTILTENGVVTEEVVINGSSQGATTTTKVYKGGKAEGTPEKTVTVTSNKDGTTVTVVDKDGKKVTIKYDIDGNVISKEEASNASKGAPETDTKGWSKNTEGNVTTFEANGLSVEIEDYNPETGTGKIDGKDVTITENENGETVITYKGNSELKLILSTNGEIKTGSLDDSTIYAFKGINNSLKLGNGNPKTVNYYISICGETFVRAKMKELGWSDDDINNCISNTEYGQKKAEQQANTPVILDYNERYLSSDTLLSLLGGEGLREALDGWLANGEISKEEYLQIINNNYGTSYSSIEEAKNNLWGGSTTHSSRSGKF